MPHLQKICLDDSGISTQNIFPQTKRKLDFDEQVQHEPQDIVFAAAPLDNFSIYLDQHAADNNLGETREKSRPKKPLKGVKKMKRQ